MACRYKNDTLQGEKGIMAKLKKNRPKSELQTIKDELALEGLDYDKTQLGAEYDMQGNIIKIQTSNTELLTILRTKGFIDE